VPQLRSMMGWLAQWTVFVAYTTSCAAQPSLNAAPLALVCQSSAIALPSHQTMPALGAQFQALRGLRGHFDGAAWRDTVDRYGGRKYCVMETLRVLVNTRQPLLTQILNGLGQPDARWRVGERALRVLSFELREVDAEQILWYRWRGTRDGLVLLVRANRVEHAEWSVAGE